MRKFKKAINIALISMLIGVVVCQDGYALRVMVAQANERMNEAMIGPKYKFSRFIKKTPDSCEGDVFIKGETFRLQIIRDSYFNVYTLSYLGKTVAKASWSSNKQAPQINWIYVNRKYRKDKIGDTIISLKGISVASMLMNMLFKDILLNNETELSNFSVENVMGHEDTSLFKKANPRIIGLLNKFGMVGLDRERIIDDIEKGANVYLLGLHEGEQPYFEIRDNENNEEKNMKYVRITLKKKNTEEVVTEGEVYKNFYTDKSNFRSIFLKILKGEHDEYEAYVGGTWGLNPSKVNWLTKYLESLPSWQDTLEDHNENAFMVVISDMTVKEGIDGAIMNGLNHRYADDDLDILYQNGQVSNFENGKSNAAILIFPKELFEQAKANNQAKKQFSYYIFFKELSLYDASYIIVTKEKKEYYDSLVYGSAPAKNEKEKLLKKVLLKESLHKRIISLPEAGPANNTSVNERLHLFIKSLPVKLIDNSCFPEELSFDRYDVPGNLKNALKGDSESMELLRTNSYYMTRQIPGQFNMESAIDASEKLAIEMGCDKINSKFKRVEDFLMSSLMLFTFDYKKLSTVVRFLTKEMTDNIKHNWEDREDGIDNFNKLVIVRKISYKNRRGIQIIIKDDGYGINLKEMDYTEIEKHGKDNWGMGLRLARVFMRENGRIIISSDGKRLFETRHKSIMKNIEKEKGLEIVLEFWLPKETTKFLDCFQNIAPTSCL